MNSTFFLDIDNMLLDSNKVKKNIKTSLFMNLGAEEATLLWEQHDSFRAQQKLDDFPHIIRTFCEKKEKDPALCKFKINGIFQSIDFRSCLLPQVKDIIAHLQTYGTVHIFTEGDMLYQTMKVKKSGIKDIVDEVFLFENKLQHLDEIVQTHENSKMYFIEYQTGVLDKIKDALPEAITIHVLQGASIVGADVYAPKYKPDVTIERIEELLNLDLD